MYLCRLQVFSVVVFGCIVDQGWVNAVCIYNGNPDACHFGNAVGIIAFLALMAFLAFDAVFDNISNVMHRKYIVMADVIFSGILSLLRTFTAMKQTGMEKTELRLYVSVNALKNYSR